MAQNNDGIIVYANNSDGSVKNNLVVVLEVQMVTNSPPVNAGGLGQIDPGIEMNAGRTTVTGVLTDPNFRAAINALQQRTGNQTLPEPEVLTTSGHEINRIGTDNISAPLAQTNRTKAQEIIPEAPDHPMGYRCLLKRCQLSEVVRTLHEESKKSGSRPSWVQFYDPFPFRIKVALQQLIPHRSADDEHCGY